MESSSTEERQQLGACNVVHVAAAQPPFRVDSTSRLIPGSPDSADDVGDAAPPSVADRVCSSTMTATFAANCVRDSTVLELCFNSSGVGLSAVTPQRADGVVASPSCGETTAKLNSACNSTPSAVNHEPVKHITTGDSLPSHSSSGDADTVADDVRQVADDMVTFRATLDAVDTSAMVGLRRARSKSVLVPVCRPPPAAVRFRSRGSIQSDQVAAHDSDADHTDDDSQHPKRRRRLFQQHQQSVRNVQTFAASYTKERIRSVSLATQRSRRSRDSTSVSDMCLEYMRLNGIVPRYASLQHHDDALIRSS